ncbi:MAG TPA: uroporphyrinogen-III synthase [Thermodesulfobacteriota bacterium]|nr:uroporphyrinogen-III synthase [Deltaproteobacteria bacterium]HNR12522.1 uroporphyrinogen-III synthase [Thermodesulfobacteriota bacterium]HNU72534.1 uroporphyrinogen-III synthase [Thermodesulfobacteriota bacterium]HOC38457.1 uroporphyrinogen-III synthase [Thermodesulfobacteriota bacterium]HQO79157.1 uroporphyrinogen-III synthase [Thermodesulfobacteriota bacterium]
MHIFYSVPGGKPLANKRILLTRPREQAQAFIDLLAARGAAPVVFPTITIIPPRDWGELDAALEKISYYDAIIFTSVNGVKFFFQRMREKEMDNSCLAAIRVCAIGSGTAARLQELGIQAGLIPDLFQAESLVEALAQEGIAGKRYLLPRAAEARDVLPEEIVRRGGCIDVVAVYQTESAGSDGEELKGLLQHKEIDVISFTSSSTVRSFVELIGSPQAEVQELVQGIIIACIGPITAETVLRYGMKPDIIAATYTVEGLTEAIISFYRRQDVQANDWHSAGIRGKGGQPSEQDG